MVGKSLLLVAALLVTMAVDSLAGDFTVINTNNSGPGSFRQAITDANASPGPDRIVFAIPGAGLQIIRPTSALPTITGPLEIDGFTQLGSSPNSLRDADNAVRRIELDGVIAGSDGLTLSTSNSVIRGLSIRQFAAAIAIQGSGNLVVGNLLGSDEAPSVFDITNVVPGNIRGVVIGGACCATIEICCNTIGGVEPRDRNVIAGNRGNAIRLGETVGGLPPILDTRIVGNFLGVDSSGVRPSVNRGSSTIHVEAVTGLVIGGLEDGARNVMANAGLNSITLFGQPRQVSILGNYIGVGADRTTAFPANSVGVRVSVTGNDLQPVIPVNYRIEGNLIANGLAGIIVDSAEIPPSFDPSNPRSASQIIVSRNSIYANTNGVVVRGGIYLGPYAQTNDVLDLDNGANNRQNFPQLISVTFQTNTVVNGVLNSAASSTYRIEFFANTAPHPSGFGEGETYLGATNVTTDFNGAAPFEVVFPGVLALQSHITATATDESGNTSMFSPPRQGRSPTSVLFHLQPKGLTVLPYTNVTFAADASGMEPVAFQWRRNGIDIAGATNKSLTLSNVVWDTRGSYTMVASNVFGAVESTPAELVVIPQPTILVSPTNLAVLPGSNVMFAVQAAGMLPLYYQWRLNGVSLVGMTNTALVLPQVQWTNRGDYTVVISNSFGVTESAPASLVVLVKPVITQQPIGQTVAAGGSATLSVAVSNSATLPLTYIWRSNNVPVSTEVSTKCISFFLATDIQTSVGYSVQVTNLGGPPGVLSSRITLVPLADTDHDGLPDVFEDANNLDRDDPGDAGLDDDGDGLSNLEEYSAGTDPQDPMNRLRVQRIVAEGISAWLEFPAHSNKTYAVQFQDTQGGPAWLTLTNLAARSEDVLERVLDPQPSACRFYRLATPSH